MNSPDRYNSIILIKYEVPYAGNVNIKLYDILGREVDMMVDAYKTAGRYQVSYNYSSFSSGLYFCLIQTEHSQAIRKLLFIK
jgi:hypothetical protein